MNNNDITLEELFKDARFHLRQVAEEKTKVRERRRVDAPKVAPSQKFAAPENWIAGRCIALIHKETQTLLGKFREYFHISEPDCRRLIREDGPAPIEAREEVSGDWGYRGPVKLSHSDSSLSEREVELFVELASPRLCAKAPLRIILQGVGILRVELRETISFGGEEILILSSGTNILPVLSQDSKIAIRKELDAWQSN